MATMVIQQLMTAMTSTVQQDINTKVGRGNKQPAAMARAVTVMTRETERATTATATARERERARTSMARATEMAKKGQGQQR